MSEAPMPIYEIKLVGSCVDCQISQEVGYHSLDPQFALPPEVCTQCGNTYQYERSSIEIVPPKGGSVREDVPVTVQADWPEEAEVVALPVPLLRDLFELYLTYRNATPIQNDDGSVTISIEDHTALTLICAALGPYVVLLESMCVGNAEPE